MSAPDALIGGRYRLVKRVGTGGMGVVWEAWDERLHRPVAIKQLHPQPGLSDAEAELVKNRAMREARITARLHHPNAVPVFDVVEHEGQPCLIMQFLPSRPLSSVLRDRELSPVEAAGIGAEVASALAAAHDAGIVHRDVKPGNILITDDGAARISDFGISHALGDATLTSTGMVHGTPAYLAPEVARGEESSSASDVFGLGATLYTMLEGAPPFGTDPNSIALLHRVASGQFDPPRRSGALTPLVERMLATEPDQRPSMNEVARTLAGLAARTSEEPPTLALTRDFVPLADRPETDRDEPLPRVTAVLPASGSVDPDPVNPASAAVGPVEVPASAAEPEQGEPSAAGSGSLDAFQWDSPHTPNPSAPARSTPTSGRRRLSRVMLVVAGLLAVAIVIAALLPSLRTGNSSAGNTPSSAAAQTTAPSSPAASSSASSSATKESTTPSASASQPSKKPSVTPSPTPSRSSSSPPATGTPSAAALAGAISNYYALVPKNTSKAWLLMTASYQQNKSGGRKAYKRFWKNIDSVSASDVSGNPPDRATATITYHYSGGRVVKERTEYGLANENGTLKIASSKVLSSTTQ